MLLDYRDCINYLRGLQETILSLLRANRHPNNERNRSQIVRITIFDCYGEIKSSKVQYIFVYIRIPIYIASDGLSLSKNE